MGLVERCRHCFANDEIAQGEWIRRFGVNVKVSVTHSVQCVNAFVVDMGRQYQCSYSWAETQSSGKLAVFCSCRHPRNCSHLWAGLIGVDKAGYSALFPGTERLAVTRHANRFGTTTETQLAAKLQAPFAAPRAADPIPEASSKSNSTSAWEIPLAFVRERYKSSHSSPTKNSAPAAEEQIWCRIPLSKSNEKDSLLLRFYTRSRRKSGRWGGLKRTVLSSGERFDLETELGQTLAILAGLAGQRDPQENFFSFFPQRPDDFVTVPPHAYHTILPVLCRAEVIDTLGDLDDENLPNQPLIWDEGPPWQLHAELVEHNTAWRLKGSLIRGEESISVEDIKLALSSELVVIDNRISRWNGDNFIPWLRMFQSFGKVDIPQQQAEEFTEKLWSLPTVPDIQLPASLTWNQVQAEPSPLCRFLPPSSQLPNTKLGAQVHFAYDGVHVASSKAGSLIPNRETKTVIRRNLKRERELIADLEAVGFVAPPTSRLVHHDLELSAKSLPKVVARLLATGWQVQAEGKLFRRPGEFHVSVRSGVNWFELGGKMDFDGQSVDLPTLLKAVERGEQFVALGDGTQGLLPEDWMAKFAPLANLGTTEDGKLTFQPSQVAILDALLVSMPSVDVDVQFDEARRRLQAFEGVKPCDPPISFQGTLRNYQREGLGWLHFLREFGFGGCLADDMGLGKTIQVLALLDVRRTVGPGEAKCTSLVVVPRSLVFNWCEEAKRFTPELRVLDYSGVDRAERLERLEDYDLVIATYGTLRRDILSLKNIAFDYVFLDEAQAVKNSQSQSAKACRLLQAKHRIAMTGTPVENHLGELWSICEFLNPGMLGRSSAIKILTGTARSTQSDDSIKLLGQALRPFILRRTKEQVLSELPDKTEQTIYCELEGSQREQYNELRDHYRALLGKKITDIGLKKSKMDVLTALLRLRQVACHPGLVDKEQRDAPSAKIETLLEQLNEVLGEGHKALVFSQFTSLLAIVRKHLDSQGILYEYLDGKIRDRQARVHRFQNDPDCPLFLISLKAGGQGLNLTAADYVFILDPWWNPAVEAQAIDRAHRIGQSKPVFAYRLIARDTVEEKILQLQSQKRKLADAIINADNSLISQLSAEDLQLLLRDRKSVV